MFKIGQRVVFVDCPDLPRHPQVVYPEIHEVVTIDHMFVGMQGFLIVVCKEYPKPITGEVNGILAICFRPIDETFAEGILKKAVEEIREGELHMVS